MAENNNEKTRTQLAVTCNEIQHINESLERIEQGMKNLPCAECFQRIGGVEKETAVIRTQLKVYAAVIGTAVSATIAFLKDLIFKA